MLRPFVFLEQMSKAEGVWYVTRARGVKIGEGHECWTVEIS